MLQLAESAGDISYDPQKVSIAKLGLRQCGRRVRIGLAQDEAFCFMYPDNLELLEALGAQLVPFSPIHDEKLPDNLDGLLLYGLFQNSAEMIQFLLQFLHLTRKQ